MYKIPANTLFVAKNLVFVPECHSTNTLALECIENQSPPDGTVVITHHQTAGRGQRGNQWITEAGKNLTLSFILKPTFLSVKDQFLLNVISSLAVRDVLGKFISTGVSIKWPNDVLVHNQKISGILVECQIKGNVIGNAIIGIGLNVNQQQLPWGATSLALESKTVYDLEIIFHRLAESLERRFLFLRNGRYEDLKQEYLSHLFWKNELRTFSSANQEFEGTITGIDPIGKLQIRTTTGLRTFDVKEVTYRR